MPRGVLGLGALFLALTPCVRVFAHGAPPVAYAVLSTDAPGSRAVSLSAGVALRRSAQRYQFVCPSAWGDQFAAPLAALPDGTIVVGASKGLMLLGEDGAVRAHPDPGAVGHISDVVRSLYGVFALRITLEGSELLAVDAQTVRVLWKDANSLYSLAALDDKLVLLRTGDKLLAQVTIAAKDGAELERQTAAVDLPVDFAFARTDAGAAYALVVMRNGTMALGSLRMNAFTKLVDGTQSIAGPLSVETGQLLALDGKLEQLVGSQATPLADDHNVVCLAQHDGLAYACESEGISRVHGPALSEPLFRFSWLVAPDLERVPVGDARMACSTQWQDLLVDMQLAGISLLQDSMPVAGSAAIAAAGSNAQPPSAALAGRGIDAPDAGGGPAVVPAQQPRGGGMGCATLRRGSASGAVYAYAVALLLARAVVTRRRRRDRILGLSAAKKRSAHNISPNRRRFLTGL